MDLGIISSSEGRLIERHSVGSNGDSCLTIEFDMFLAWMRILSDIYMGSYSSWHRDVAAYAFQDPLSHERVLFAHCSCEKVFLTRKVVPCALPIPLSFNGISTSERISRGCQRSTQI